VIPAASPWSSYRSEFLRENVGIQFLSLRHHEYARLGGFIHVNSAENYFSIFKRGVIGTYHHISEQHLDKYLAEFDFRYNNRSGLDIEDGERAAKALKGIEGKRLTYRIPDKATHA
jgi:hypothetical protein